MYLFGCRPNAMHIADERGAIFIHVGVGMLFLLMFLAFVVDYGLLWSARTQAQTAADAGALAGAQALAFDGDTDVADRARNVAWTTATSNIVWGAAPGAVPQSPYQIPSSDSDDKPCNATKKFDCIRVDVYRDGDGANRGGFLPTLFAGLFGRSTQGTRAMAVAEVGNANTSDCLKPFAIPDFYTDTGNDGWGPGDSYSAPGYTLASHLGTELLLRDTTEDRVKPGWFRLLDLIGATSGGGADELRDVIKSCAGDPKGVGDILDPKMGSTNGIKHAVEDLLDLDRDAEYDPVSKRVVNSCADDRSCYGYTWDGSEASSSPVPDPGRSYSPRIIPLAIFDPTVLATTGEIQVVNILGFFLSEDTQWTGSDKYLKGTIVSQPGLFDRGAGAVGDDAAFTKVVRLVR